MVLKDTVISLGGRGENNVMGRTIVVSTVSNALSMKLLVHEAQRTLIVCVDNRK